MRRFAARPARMGVALIEMLFVIALLGVFALVASSLFTTTMKVVHRTNVDDATTRAMDSAMAQLRRDVWNAGALRTEGARLIVDRRNGAVEWSVDASTRQVRRLQVGRDNVINTWPVDRLNITFEVSGPSLSVLVSDSRAQPVALERLVSQVMLAAGGAS